jgi:hypothetical protein
MDSIHNAIGIKINCTLEGEVDILKGEILDLKDHIKTLKDFLDEKNKLMYMISESAYLKDKISRLEELPDLHSFFLHRTYKKKQPNLHYIVPQ